LYRAKADETIGVGLVQLPWRRLIHFVAVSF